MSGISVQEVAKFIPDVLADLGPLTLTDVPAEEMDGMPYLKVLMKNTKEASGYQAPGEIPWLMAVNSWAPYWPDLLKAHSENKTFLVHTIRTARTKCLTELARFIDSQFKHQVFSLAEPNGRGPDYFWMYLLKGEFLRETWVNPLREGQACYFINATYAYGRKP